MQLQLISSTSKTVQFANAEETVGAAWRKARMSGTQLLMLRTDGGALQMLRRDELERFASVRPQQKIVDLPLHDVGEASSQATVRELESMLHGSGVDAVAMMRADEVLAVLTRPTPLGESAPTRRVAPASKFRSAA